MLNTSHSPADPARAAAVDVHEAVAPAADAASAAPASPASTAVHRLPCPTREEERVYKQTARGPLAMHLVRPQLARPDPHGRPAVLFFHGGGWRRGRPQQFLPFATLLAQRGIVAMSAAYRLIEDEHEAIPTEGLADARSALRWLRAHAAELGIDPARIAVGGGSSGAHLALMIALGDDGLDDPADDLTVPLDPAALLLLNPPLDFDGYESEVPVAQRHRYSPHHLLNASLPPALICHGTRDQVIPFAQAGAFAARAHKLGAPEPRVVPFEGRGHGFFNRGKGVQGDTLRVAREMVGFLRGLGWDV